MQIAQSEILRLIDDNGIGIGDINSTFDNGSRQQHIIIIVHKVENNLLKFFRLHLSMTDANTAVRDVSFNHCFQLHQVLYPIVYKKYLTVTTHLEVDSLSDNFFIECMHLGLDGVAIGGRSLYHRKVARTHQ